MRKVLIITTTRGKSLDSFNTEQSLLAKLSSNYLHEPVEAHANVYDENKSELLRLSENIKIADECDYIVFASGFEEDKSCRTMYEIAMRFWKTVLIEHGNKLKGVS